MSIELENVKDNDYIEEPSLVSKCIYHVIFCPKYRRKVLIDDIPDRMKELILQKQSDYHYTIIEQEIMPDHVHLLIKASAKYSIYNIVSQLKGYLSHTLREEFPSLKTRLPTLWSRNKFIASVGTVSLETVKQYIENQKNK